MNTSPLKSSFVWRADRHSAYIQPSDKYSYFFRKRRCCLTQDDNYHWFHYLFGRLLEQDSEFRRLWALTPKISADGPHVLQRTGLLKPATDRTGFAIKNRFSNVHKLTRRGSFPDDIAGTVLDSLYRFSEGLRR